MLYEKTPGRIKPFHEDQSSYIFRYFCGSDSRPQIPREQSLPKSHPEYVCHCGAPMKVEIDEEGPFLRFFSGRHFAAKERDSN
jgi:hypothetical protein